MDNNETNFILNDDKVVNDNDNSYYDIDIDDDDDDEIYNSNCKNFYPNTDSEWLEYAIYDDETTEHQKKLVKLLIISDCDYYKKFNNDIILKSKNENKQIIKDYNLLELNFFKRFTTNKSQFLYNNYIICKNKIFYQFTNYEILLNTDIVDIKNIGCCDYEINKLYDFIAGIFDDAMKNTTNNKETYNKYKTLFDAIFNKIIGKAYELYVRDYLLQTNEYIYVELWDDITLDILQDSKIYTDDSNYYKNFEKIAKKLFNKTFETENVHGDFGFDILAKRIDDPRYIGIQCKFSSKSKIYNIKYLETFLEAVIKYKYNPRGIFFYNNGFIDENFEKEHFNIKFIKLDVLDIEKFKKNMISVVDSFINNIHQYNNSFFIKNDKYNSYYYAIESKFEDVFISIQKKYKLLCFTHFNYDILRNIIFDITKNNYNINRDEIIKESLYARKIIMQYIENIAIQSGKYQYVIDKKKNLFSYFYIMIDEYISKLEKQKKNIVRRKKLDLSRGIKIDL
jgi:hypothetical protein